MNTPQLVSAVIAHADKQHEDSRWAIVFEGMRRDEIAAVIAGAKTVNQAVRKMSDHLDSLLVRA